MVFDKFQTKTEQFGFYFYTVLYSLHGQLLDQIYQPKINSLLKTINNDENYILAKKEFISFWK